MAQFIPSKETEMFKNRFKLIALMLVVLLVSLAVASPLSNDPGPVDTSWPPRPDYSHLDEGPATKIGNLDAYHQSERTLVDPYAGLAVYQLSERTFVDPYAGLEMYQNSERTSVPVRFTKFQLSEWFGK
jgi:hypothetical protein